MESSSALKGRNQIHKLEGSRHDSTKLRNKAAFQPCGSRKESSSKEETPTQRGQWKKGSKTEICPQFVQLSQRSEEAASKRTKRFSVREAEGRGQTGSFRGQRLRPGVSLRDGPNNTATLSFRQHKGLKCTARQRQTHTFVTERRFQPRATNASQSREPAGR